MSAQEQLDQVCALIHERLPSDQAIQIAEFTQLLYQRMPEDQMDAHNVLDLYGAAVAHWRFVQKYQSQQTQLQIYNPELEQHGWQSVHTIITILTDNIPFLVDSLRMTLNREGITLHLSLHPTLSSNKKALIYFEIDHQTEQTTISQLKQVLNEVLQHVHAGVEDWPQMSQMMVKVLQELPVDQTASQEEHDFLAWVNDQNFTYLGYQCYQINPEQTQKTVITDSKLGILKLLPDANLPLATQHRLLRISKWHQRSKVHRPSYMDCLSIRQATTEHCFLGLYTASAYNHSILDIPLLRYKADQVTRHHHYSLDQHDGRALLNILETFPRDELFRIEQSQLETTALSILQLQERQKISVFVHDNECSSFFSCLMFIPREHYSTQLRHRIEAILLSTFLADHIEFNPFLSESMLAQVYFLIHSPNKSKVTYDIHKLETQIIALTHTWQDDMRQALLEHEGEAQGTHLLQTYHQSFPVAYCDDFEARTVVQDIKYIESLTDAPSLSLYWPTESLDNAFRLKLFSKRHISLSEALPIFENMGVTVIDERPYEIQKKSSILWIQDFGLTYTFIDGLEPKQLKTIFQETFLRVWCGDAENDPFNQLGLCAQLNWREISVLRAYSHYMRQAGSTFSHAYMTQTLVNNPHLAKQLLALFIARFNPQRNQPINELVRKIEKDLDNVNSLDEDRILRRFLGVILATLRTNYFQKDRNRLSFKFDSTKVPDLPEPHPRYEIFVYSPQVEGVHLRGGHIARGGLRWSDRLEDFRTEVLGLVKAQLVKNALIVPVGSKGGFIIKNPPKTHDRERITAHAIQCYKTFIRGLLDLTDNRINNEIITPDNVVRYDIDDSYLVVAADKGTATFSDIANQISREYQFWLDDAFASGGSTGYDHKKMGITARGAWECVKRHFREIGHNIQTTPFTVVGIGDMSGDVFGNGMLLSPQIKLVAAFNHQHIFLDPDPDPNISFQERQRLFQLPRSKWTDYSTDLLSTGGGIYSRDKKSIPLSPEVQQLLQVKISQLTPNALIHAILQAPVDLLWNGGIGTYIKASTETDADTGDRNNDIVRINANQLRCTVVGEGGNLGLTQNARIEYALNNGLINTDAIDNAGGVNCSDHEVNIKITLHQLINQGDLTDKQRIQLLQQMTDKVATLVLRDNYTQSLNISLSQYQAIDMLEVHQRFINSLENANQLDRELEFLPSNTQIEQRKTAGKALTRPELSVLLAYAKLTLTDELQSTQVTNDPAFQIILHQYFPDEMVQRFEEAINQHSLRAEIMISQMVNQLVDYAGITFAHRLHEETGAAADNIFRAYFASCAIFNLPTLWHAIEALDNQIDTQIQLDLFLTIRRLAERSTHWLLRHQGCPFDTLKTIDYFQSDIKTLQLNLPNWLPFELTTCPDWQQTEIPEALAQQLSSFDIMTSGLDIVTVSKQTHKPLSQVVQTYFLLGIRLQLNWLSEQTSLLPRQNQWQSLSRHALRDDLLNKHQALVITLLNQQNDESQSAVEQIDRWLAQRQVTLARYLQILDKIKACDTIDLAMLSVALRELQNLLVTIQ